MKLFSKKKSNKWTYLIVCRRRHTLTLIPSRGRVYAFGLGGVGQLGNKIKNASTPQVVLGPWVSSLDSDNTCTVRRIYSGGDHCFVTVSKKQVSWVLIRYEVFFLRFLNFLIFFQDNVAPEDCRVWPKNSQILDIDINYLKQCINLSIDSPVDQELMTSVFYTSYF